MRQIRKVAVVGGGLIGMSWASLFLARGLQVTVVDPRPDAEAKLTRFVERAWPMMQTLDLTRSDEVGAAAFSTTTSSLAGIDFVAECGPDRIEIKRQMIRELERGGRGRCDHLLQHLLLAGLRYPKRGPQS